MPDNPFQLTLTYNWDQSLFIYVALAIIVSIAILIDSTGRFSTKQSPPKLDRTAKIQRPPGYRFANILTWFFGRKVFDTHFSQVVLDINQEYNDAIIDFPKFLSYSHSTASLDHSGNFLSCF